MKKTKKFYLKFIMFLCATNTYIGIFIYKFLNIK